MKAWGLHLALLGTLAVAFSVLPTYHATNLARIMVLAVFAMGYNIAFGYTGLLSLGHALFFASGMYGGGMLAQFYGVSALPAMMAGLICGAAMAAAVGLLALRTAGVSFMIVTLMFAQAGYLTLLYFGAVTGGDEGFVPHAATRMIAGHDLSQDAPRFLVAFSLFAGAMILNLMLVLSRFGRVMVAMRENEERSRMLGYDPFSVKLTALVISGAYAGLAGAAYAMLFGYVGASFATIQYSILPLLYVLLGGAGTVAGPFLGALLMFYLIDTASSHTSATLFVVGLGLIILIMFAPRGILGSLRDRGPRWLP